MHFEPVDNLVKYRFEPGEVIPECQCGEVILLAEDGNTYQCECGRIYRLSEHYVQIDLDSVPQGDEDGFEKV